MPTIIGLSGSLRAGSFNTTLLRAATGLIPEDTQLLVRTIHGIPLYDGDVEASVVLIRNAQLFSQQTVAGDHAVSVTLADRFTPKVATGAFED
jgi:chromate reductase